MCSQWSWSVGSTHFPCRLAVKSSLLERRKHPIYEFWGLSGKAELMLLVLVFAGGWCRGGGELGGRVRSFCALRVLCAFSSENRRSANRVWRSPSDPEPGQWMESCPACCGWAGRSWDELSCTACVCVSWTDMDFWRLFPLVFWQ